ncbi:hypothetical protein [Streptomyces sp. NPDC018693]|uniref:hypothetical protein n=1 Tax=unclassified Streptomyces TaxID=2593676 RepID=UPI0037909651
MTESVKTPAKRAEEDSQTRRITAEWGDYDPTVPDPEADAPLARRIAEVDAA